MTAFDRNTIRDLNKVGLADMRVKWLFVIGLVVAIVVLILHWAIPDFSPESKLHGALIVIMGLMPAFAAVIGGYAEKMAFSAQAKRYEWMSALFHRADDRLKGFLAANDTDSAHELIFEVGKEALEENGDWVMILRERTVDVYQGP